jgi:GcrA cell cycle regulator
MARRNWSSVSCFDLGVELTKTKRPISRPAASGGLLQTRQDAARQNMANEERSKKPLPASVPVRFMELRNSMCRWPIGDPHDFDSFRFCGCQRSSEAIYCETHMSLAFVPQRRKILVPKVKGAYKQIPSA